MSGTDPGSEHHVLRQKLSTHLVSFQQRTGRQLICSLCGSTSWGIGMVVVFPIPVNPLIKDGRENSNERHIFVPLSCNFCGNSHFINVIKAGIVVGIGQQKESTDNPGTITLDPNVQSEIEKLLEEKES
jgi:hypothetical protein